MSKKRKKISDITVIGTGNVAYHLVKAFTSNGLNVVQVVARTEASAKRFSRSFRGPVITSAPSLLVDTDLYILAVNDDRIRDAARALNINDQFVVHTSGAIPMDVLEDISTNTGVFYPIQTLSYGKDIAFSDIPVCIEANTPGNLTRLNQLARKVTSRVHHIDSRQRLVMHMAAVFASNFSYHMFTVAATLLKKENIDPVILHPLILETAAKATRSAPGSTQTGPAAREDNQVIQHHLELLKDNRLYSDIYKLLSESIISHKKKSNNEL